MYFKTKIQILFFTLAILLPPCILILSLHETTFAAASAKYALDYYNNGVAAMVEGRYAEAIAQFEKAIEIEKKDEKLRIGMISYEYLPNQKLEECRRLLAPAPQPQKTEAVVVSIPEQKGPEIAIHEPSVHGRQRVAYGQKSITIKGRINSENTISFLKVNQNTIVYDKKGGFEAEVPLNVGKNRITVQTQDGSGKTAEIVLSVERDKPAFAVKDIYQKSLAVIIGIDDYERLPGVDYAVNSALNMQKKLKEMGFQDIVVLLDREASKERVYCELFSKLQAKAGPEDRVVIYFAGHSFEGGSTDDAKRKFILSSNSTDSDITDKDISLELIKDIAIRISAKHVLCIFDTCFSGLDAYMISSRTDTDVNDYGLMANNKVVQVITSRCDDAVVEKDGSGLLTSNLLKGISGEADINGDTIITGSELGNFVEQMTRQKSKKRQALLFGKLSGNGEFFWK